MLNYTCVDEEHRSLRALTLERVQDLVGQLSNEHHSDESLARPSSQVDDRVVIERSVQKLQLVRTSLDFNHLLPTVFLLRISRG